MAKMTTEQATQHRKAQGLVVADLTERKAAATTAAKAARAKDWRDMSAVEFTTRPKAAQVAMFDTGDHPTTGTIGLFDI